MGCLVRIVWGYIKRVGRRWRRKRVKSIGNLSEWKEEKKRSVTLQTKDTSVQVLG